METLNLFVQFVKVIGIIVTIHELGHFLTAKACGMRAEIFAVGMGFRLFGWNKINGFTFGNLPENWDGGDHTDYRLCLLPIGGYVKISGMVDESFDNEQLVSEPKPWEFRSKNPFQKALVISAGVLFNFILSFGIYSSIAFSEGKNESATTTVSFVQSGSVCYSAGMRAGDKILSINNKPVNSWEDIASGLTLEHLGEDRFIEVQTAENVKKTIKADGKSLVDAITQKKGLGIAPDGIRIVTMAVESMMPAENIGIKAGDTLLSLNGNPLISAEEFVTLITKNKEKPLEISWKHGNLVKQDTINPKYDGSVNRWRIGVQTGQLYAGPKKHSDYTLAQALSVGLDQTNMNISLFFKTISSIFQGKMSFRESIGGPVQIAKIAGQQAEKGITDFLLLVASLSVSIAVINILPIPALDGGHLVFIIIEGITKKEVPIKVKMMVQQIGVALLLLLFLFITINDLIK
ncbi:MAG: Sigma protease regulator [Bacteroidota bacterium]